MARDYIKLYAELGVKLQNETGAQAIGFCPVHNDTEKPSFSFNKDNGLFKCFVATCKAFNGGNFEQFYKLVTGKEFDEEIPTELIEKAHQQLIKNSGMRKWLLDSRGITLETIEKYKLGTDDDRLWIPIKSEGKYVNIRKHSPNKKARIKTLSHKSGMGSARVWPDDSIKAGEEVIICEGELDCLLANQMGFNAVTVTGGAGTWKDEFTALFNSVSSIAICYDIDLAGRAGVNVVAKKLSTLGKPIKDVNLPITQPSNGDFTDYVVTYGATKESFRTLIDNAEIWSPDESKKQEDPRQIHTRNTDVGGVAHPSFLGQRVSLKATIIGIDQTPYVAPKSVELSCKEAGKRRACMFCNIAFNNGKLVLDIPPYSQDILRSIDISEEQQKQHYRKVGGVAPNCPPWEFNILDSYTVFDSRVVPEISYKTDVTVEYTQRQAFAVGHNIKANHTYEFEGTPYSSPKNQSLTLLLDKAIPVKDSLDDFKLDNDQIKQLEVFQAKTSVAAKMYDIAHDLSLNVTHIIDREVLLIALDLAYHSPLSFIFQGRFVQKGRVDLLVLGDTRCGKSESFIGIVNHYKAGEIITGENTSKAGLLGGVQQNGNRWITTWGKLSMNDRRLLIIDEISGMPVEDIGQLSGVRASGIAEVTKIQSEKMLARTRTVWAGNPRSNRPLSAYDTGVQAIQELIGRPEDIARFDIAVCLRSGEVSLDRINTTDRQKVEHIYTSDLCNKLVMWAWSRRPEDIIFEKDAEKLCLELATSMSQRYSSAIPLVEGAEQRIKLARLAVASAVRLFSTTTGENVLVKKEHVQYVHDLLEEIYSGPGLNYLAYSKVKIAEQNLKDEQAVRDLISIHGIAFIEGLLDHQYLKLGDFEDMLNLERKEIKPIIYQLLRNKAIKHYGNFYAKTPAFITLLRKMQIENHKEPEKQEVGF